VPITPENRADDCSPIKDAVTIGGAHHSSRYALDEAQRTYSLRRGVQRCGQAGHKCGSAWHGQCAAARSGQLRRDLTASLRHHNGTTMLWTATIATAPGKGIRQAWGDLLAVLQATTRGGWLQRHGVAGSARAIEPEISEGGVHVHAHILLVFRSQLDTERFRQFALTVRSRYLAEADRLGIAASAAGQDVSLVRSLPRVVRYITKMGVRANGTDSLSRLWAAVEQGDAEALAMVHELEGAAYRRRPGRQPASADPSWISMISSAVEPSDGQRRALRARHALTLRIKFSRCGRNNW